MSWQGRHVVVTGGLGVLGSAVVRHLVEAGATCHVPARDGPPEGILPAGPGSVEVHPGVDLLDEAAVARLYAGLPPPWASIHAAGGFAMGPVVELSLADLRAQLDVNLATCFLACREAIRAIRRAGVGGRIVNVAARAAITPSGDMAAYVAAKGAVAALTLALAEETRAEGILVNAVLPSIFDTPANRRAMPHADFSRWPTANDVARAIVWLASPDNVVTTGALVPVPGRG